jgi:hypothetical protein
MDAVQRKAQVSTGTTRDGATPILSTGRAAVALSLNRVARAYRTVATTLLLLAAGCGGITSQNESDASGDAEGYADASTGKDADANADASPSSNADAVVDAGARQSDGAASVLPPEASAPGADAGGCSASTCPAGCCDSDGHCQSGSPTSCGTGGLACETCPPGMQCQDNVFCACTPESCPNGCCNDSFVLGMADSGAACLAGTSDVACGGGGADCQDCTFNGITGTGGTCGSQLCTLPPPCSCMTGCCDHSGQCQPGASNTQCGERGGYCRDCTVSGTQCDMGQCTGAVDAGVCNAQTCPSGCCDELEHCQQGISLTSCGNFGTGCQNCPLAPNLPPGAQAFAVCSDQQCMWPTVVDSGCNPGTCAGCCDATGLCVDGSADAVCGNRGTLCVDCTTLGDTCDFGMCTASDGGLPCSQTCDGCCDTNGNCQLGFADAQCGGLGTLCTDCTALGPPSTCDLGASPRACTSQQTQCPAPYPGCPAFLEEQAPATQTVCSKAELQNAATACAGGASTDACGAFLSAEQNSNDACANCLRTFDYDFVTQSGVRSCVAPFVDATCNHNSACVAECVWQSCLGCTDQESTEACEAQAATTPCAAYFQADPCVTQALAGPGAVCNPASYQQNFGAWLQAVGGAYCGQ